MPKGQHITVGTVAGNRTVYKDKLDKYGLTPAGFVMALQLAGLLKPIEGTDEGS